MESPNAGRDHHGGNFTMWFAGGGLKPGFGYGTTDDFSYNVVENPTSIHDLHATLMHLLGIDHSQLTYRYQGRDSHEQWRCTRAQDFHGNEQGRKQLSVLQQWRTVRPVRD